MIKEDYIGTGSLTEFVESSNQVFAALNKIDVRMPDGYSGDAPTFEIDSGQLVLDMRSALVFSLENVNWTFTEEAGAEVKAYGAYVKDGQLFIKITTGATT